MEKKPQVTYEYGTVNNNQAERLKKVYELLKKKKGAK